jgi:hypothetical protein
LAFDENGGNLVSVTAMDVAGNLATVDQTLVIDTVAPSFTTQANTEISGTSNNHFYCSIRFSSTTNLWRGITG